MSKAATTETRTQYGIKLPNGKIVWSTPENPKYAGVSIEDSAVGKMVSTSVGMADAGRVMHNALVKKAEDANIDISDYLDGHAYVSRDIITVTMDHDVLDRRVQFTTAYNGEF